MSTQQQLAAAAKAEGNKAFKSRDFKTAIDHYTRAIGYDDTQHSYYSNRSACYVSLGQSEEALADADKCIELNPSWPKGYSRRGMALFRLSRFEEAKTAYEAGLKLAPTNAGLLDGLKSTNAELQKAASPFGKLFGPSMWGKLQSSPTTAAYMQDPKFLQKMTMLQQNPNLLNSLAQDPQVGAALQVLLGIPVQAGPGPEAATSNGPTPAERRRAEEARKAEEERRALEEEKKRKAEEERKRQEELNAMSAEEKLAEANKQKAAETKVEGNALFKKKQYDAAIAKYEEAFRLDGTNPTYLTNVAAALSMKKDHAGSIAKCTEALEVARSVRFKSYTFVAKTWFRIGNGYYFTKEYKKAIEAYDKSLLEENIDKCANMKVKAEKKLKEQLAREYLSKPLSLEAKARGNQLYKEQKFALAIKEYSEAIKRDPTNHVFYSNRANCYAKLMTWSSALADCEKCIKLKPEFTKIYIRKGKILHFLKNYKGAIEAYETGLKLDPESTELQQGRFLTYQKIREQNATGQIDPQRRAEAMKDPEIVAILQDPVVSDVLKQAQSNPRALQMATRDPVISAKIEKLIQAGVLQMR